MKELMVRMNELCDRYPFHVGWYLKNLRTGAAGDRNGDVVIPSASTRKIAILVAALQAVNAGGLALDQMVTIEAKYQDNESGCFRHFAPGFQLPLLNLLIPMIVISDNTCTGIIAEMVGLDAINAMCRSIGMKGTTHRHTVPPRAPSFGLSVDTTNATTPADVGLLLETVLQGADDEAAAGRLGCTTALCRQAMDILSWQLMNTRLPLLLPLGTKVAHKTGTNKKSLRCCNDAGIIFHGEDPLFILTVYTENIPPELPDGAAGHSAACLLIAQLSRMCYDALKA